MKKAARRWTEDEDQVLRKAVAKYQENESIVWHEVASNFTDRNNKDCRKRWVYTLAPSIKKGAWDDSEDALLLKGIEKHGYKWALVSQVVGSRQPDQCSRRWHETLNPNITHSRWSLQEDQKLKDAVQMYGRRWTEIVERFFPDRTPIAAKNRYTQRFASRSGAGSPARASSVRPESRAQSITSSVDDDEDMYLHTVPDLMWRTADGSHGSQRGVPMGMAPAQHFRSNSQLGQIQTQGFAVAPHYPGSTIDGFLPHDHHTHHKTYSASGASVYESSPNSTIDMFSPHSATQASGIDTPMDLSPEGYFPQIAGQGMVSHSRHPSMHSGPDALMIHPELDSTLLDHSMIDMHHFVQGEHPKAMGHDFNQFSHPQQHPQVDMAAVHQAHFFHNGGNVMH